MPKYIAFLRGINVGNIRIKMSDLKVCFEKLGFQDVSTYLQSGNVVFEASQTAAEIKAILEKGLSETFKYDAFALIYPFESLQTAIQSYPFSKDEQHHAYVLFVDDVTVFAELKTIASNLESDSDQVAADEAFIYWKAPVGQSTDTPFSKTLAKAKYKKCTTVRNVNTLEKML